MHSQPTLVPTLLLHCSTHSQPTHHCMLWDLLCNNAQVNTHNYPHSRSCLQSSQWMLFWPCSHIHCPASSIRGQLEWSGPFLEAPNGLDIGFWTISSTSIGTWERVATECSNCPAFRVGHGRISMHTHWTANMAVILWNPHNLTISPERGHWLQPSPHHAPQEFYTTSMCITHYTSHITTLHTTPQTQKMLV